ncbi:hypothetical protein [Metabacillus malikii]|uniref:Uncharacterized protein n=1 Tax=Metabacillus malikii TaxID=1504265 RepID=A0ABT9Z9H6_9BACI|nr:hypothetical protein [Metabacillus malikii]MDQ0228901.1 hypothetical protein [Metabacillus malikii]
MSQHYYHLCCRYNGKVVRINDSYGRVHVGKICRVTPHKVFIQPLNQRPGYGFGYYGYGYGYPYGIGLGLITGIALAGLFFW